MKILLLEDDEVLAESLQEYLEMEGFEVDRVSRGEAFFERSYEEKYDLYILDINVPDLNGLEVLRAMKEAEDSTPAIYISALTDIASMTRGFDLGALDYIKKPFDPEELVLRIHRHFRSSQSAQEALRYGHFRFDPVSGKVETEEGESFYLGEVQRRLLQRLLERPGELVSSSELMEMLEHPGPNALRVAMAKLKKKLGLRLKNVRSQGYLLEEI